MLNPTPSASHLRRALMQQLTCSAVTPWDSWEMHPKGSELVLCTVGEMTLLQELDGVETRTHLAAGQYAINQPGVWHTAEVKGSATAVFITSGAGTSHRPR